MVFIMLTFGDAISAVLEASSLVIDITKGFLGSNGFAVSVICFDANSLVALSSYIFS